MIFWRRVYGLENVFNCNFHLQTSSSFCILAKGIDRPAVKKTQLLDLILKGTEVANSHRFL